MPHKLNNPHLLFLFVSLFPLFSYREGGGEMMGDCAGRYRLHRRDRQLYSPTV
jgi:hypothetical protein